MTMNFRFAFVIMAVLVSLFATSLAASPLHLRIQTKEFTNTVRVDVSVSLHVGPSPINNRSVGRYYVPKNGTPVVKTIHGIPGMGMLRLTMNSKNNAVNAVIKMMNVIGDDLKATARRRY